MKLRQKRIITALACPALTADALLLGPAYWQDALTHLASVRACQQPYIWELGVPEHS